MSVSRFISIYKYFLVLSFITLDHVLFPQSMQRPILSVASLLFLAMLVWLLWGAKSCEMQLQSSLCLGIHVAFNWSTVSGTKMNEHCGFHIVCKVQALFWKMTICTCVYHEQHFYLSIFSFQCTFILRIHLAFYNIAMLSSRGWYSHSYRKKYNYNFWGKIFSA